MKNGSLLKEPIIEFRLFLRQVFRQPKIDETYKDLILSRLKYYKIHLY